MESLLPALWQIEEYLKQGGWVMIPLAICSLVMWTLILERLHAFRGLTGRDIEIRQALFALNGGHLDTSGKGLFTRLLRRFMQERSGVSDIDRHVLRQVSQRLRRDLSRFLAVIAVLAGIAPLLGLLGTVLGMIETFDVISVFGTGNAKAMAGGISVALITTQTGLLVAIPGLFLSGFLMRRASRLEIRLNEFTTILERHIRRGIGPEPEGEAA
jgi:biopolymer transport protein ExbB